MTKRLSLLHSLVLFSLLIPALAWAKPLLGFSVAVATDGFLSTTLVEVKIASVQAGSPSEKAGLKVGDLIIEMNGKPIKGANGMAMKKSLGSVKAGETVALKVQRAGHGLMLINIVAGS